MDSSPSASIITVAVIAFLFLFSSCKNEDDGPVAITLKDSSGITYGAVKIGTQIWQAWNMNVKTKHSVCYNNKKANCAEYGRLYTLEEALKICPEGWHLPTREDFETLIRYLGGSEKGASSVKLRHNSWANGTNDFGLSVLPAGYHPPKKGEYKGLKGDLDIGTSAEWWVNSAKSDPRYLFVDRDSVRIFGGYSEEHGFSVRCLKN